MLYCTRDSRPIIIIIIIIIALIIIIIIIINDDENTKILNSLFFKFKDVDFLAECISHPAIKVITKFCNRPKVFPIRNAFNPQSLSFSQVSVEAFSNETKKLGNTKTIQNTEMPVKILKQNPDMFWSYICQLFNVCVDKSTFPSSLKKANITSVFKKRYKGSKKTTYWRLFSLSYNTFHLSYDQITPFMDYLLCNCQCCFWKGFSAQCWLLAILEKWKRAVDTKTCSDLSKEFDFLQHDLIITKLSVYVCLH